MNWRFLVARLCVDTIPLLASIDMCIRCIRYSYSALTTLCCSVFLRDSTIYQWKPGIAYLGLVWSRLISLDVLSCHQVGSVYPKIDICCAWNVYVSTLTLPDFSWSLLSLFTAYNPSVAVEYKTVNTGPISYLKTQKCLGCPPIDGNHRTLGDGQLTPTE